VSPPQKAKQTYRGHLRYTKEDTLALLQGIAQYGKVRHHCLRRRLPAPVVPLAACRS
jgi:hypothetical protein